RATPVVGGLAGRSGVASRVWRTAAVAGPAPPAQDRPRSIESRKVAAMGSNASLWEREQRVLPSWLAVYYDEPIALERGEGCAVWDAEGTRYLDFFGGILTTISGHGVPEIVAAIREQAGQILHTATTYVSPPMVELAEMVAELSGIPDAKVFFTTSGTEANDTALLLCTAYRRSNQVLALRNSY